MDDAINAPLARHTTLRIGGEANRLCHPHTKDELVELVDQCNSKGEPWFILGGGSNLLISSEGFKGTVIRTTNLLEITNPEPGILVASAGARLPHIAKFAASLGLSGLEFAVGIPGTVGGGVIMNCGAHGSSLPLRSTTNNTCSNRRSQPRSGAFSQVAVRPSVLGWALPRDGLSAA